MAAPSPDSPVPRQPDDPDYIRMVELAESVLDEIARPSPDWSRVGREAGELAQLAGAICQPS
jgi:hypothetical protein